MSFTSLKNLNTSRGNAVMWVIFVVVIIGIIFAATRYSKNNPEAGTQNKDGVVAIAEVTADDQTIGSLDAPIQFVEYSDFECPFCADYHIIIKEVLDQVGDDVVFAYRHRPLRSVHFNAQAAAEAAEAAGLQGEFFAMHDILFENQEVWKKERNPEDLFMQYAEDIGLDVEKFEEDLNSKEVRDRVNADLEEAIELNINSTPSLFIDGWQLPSGLSSADIVDVIQKLLTGGPEGVGETESMNEEGSMMDTNEPADSETTNEQSEPELE